MSYAYTTQSEDENLSLVTRYACTSAFSQFASLGPEVWVLVQLAEMIIWYTRGDSGYHRQSNICGRQKYLEACAETRGFKSRRFPLVPFAENFLQQSFFQVPEANRSMMDAARGRLVTDFG